MPASEPTTLPRREVHVVVAAEVARVVVRDALLERRARERQPAARDELVEQLAVVDDLVVAAELRVLVLQHVEAVRALRDDLLARPCRRTSRCSAWRASGRCTRCPSGGPGRRCTARSARGSRSRCPARCMQLGQRRGSSSCCGRRSCPRSRRSRGTRGRTAPPGSTISTPSSDSAQSPRSPWFMPYAFPEFSIDAVRVAELGRGSRSPSASGSAACRGSCRGSRC